LLCHQRNPRTTNGLNGLLIHIKQIKSSVLVVDGLVVPLSWVYSAPTMSTYKEEKHKNRRSTFEGGGGVALLCYVM
jgi:hypothetical protein